MSAKMRAVVYTQYGSPEVLQLKEVEKPTPGKNEILIRIKATPVNFGDLLARNFRDVTPRAFNMPAPLWLPTRIMLGINKPNKKILGSEFSGEIEATGSGVTGFNSGDPVFGYRGINFGSYAEYLCMPAKGVVALKPASISDEQACAIPYGSTTALNLLRKVNIQSGDSVLINGASGSIGSYAVQLAKHYGAEVTGVCSTPRVEYVRSLGADAVIDYTKEDFSQNGKTYDIIFDILGKSSFKRCRGSLKENGIYLRASFKTRELRQMLWTKITGGKRVICALAPERSEDLVFIKELIEKGKIKSVIDKTFPLQQAAEAHRYTESGEKKGSIVLTVE